MFKKFKTNYVVGCIFEDKGRFLFEKRFDNENNYAGFWTFPMGHKRFYETNKFALKREMHEELSINLKSNELKFIGKFEDIDPTSKKPYIFYIYSCKYSKLKIKGTREQEKLQWLDFKQASKKGTADITKNIILRFKKMRHLQGQNSKV